MTRPAPRKSSLAGASPVAPPPEAVPAKAAPSPVVAQTATQPAAATTPAKKTERKTKYPPKVSFYQDPEDTARVRGAILHTMTTEGPRNLSQFINQAVMAEVERLEAKYNGGQPFPSVGARELPQGRPMGE
ncbi:hypothetical protein ET495_17375 (plasmid) [Xylanimonas allomyrinae]|uniref:ParB-like C-terminal domain-containing protein n=1 Tax=Xylanimonas allomyrinae TaxID=2509459 RepID=A0A4P6EQ94_9MICO|nr:hypothetical protein [Xylanimonas allomyrinae]QAY64992.1 hypothetical protein ET495_17375 [Xylanimonas allomyrinae]